jgi:hypothetical protein
MPISKKSLAARSGSRSVMLAAFLLTAVAARTARATGTDWPIVAATASSGTSPASNVFDKNINTSWSSAQHSSAQNTEWIQINLDTAHPINYIKVVPSLNSTENDMPAAFTVSWFDGTTWRPVRSFTNFKTFLTFSDWFRIFLSDVPSQSSPISYAPAQATAVRVTATVLTGNSASPPQYGFTLRELRAGYDPAMADTVIVPTFAGPSSALAGWPASNVLDGNPGTSWSSVSHPTPVATESIQIDFAGGTRVPVNAIRLLPRYDASGVALGFPVDFSVAYSDGSAWNTLASYTNFPIPSSGEWVVLSLGINFTTANGLQIVATKLGNDRAGNNIFQMAEMQGQYSDSMNTMVWTGNNGAAQSVQISDSSAQFTSLFKNASYQLGNTSLVFGPGSPEMLGLNDGMTLHSPAGGRFEIYEPDGQTLLFRSSAVTTHAGDKWSFDPSTYAINCENS